MDLEAVSGAATIALASTIVFLLIVKSWQAVAHSGPGTASFPNSIMQEAAQRFRDRLEQLGREQSVYLTSALVFTVVFAVAYLLNPQEMFGDVPRWQLISVLVLLTGAALYVLWQLLTIGIKRRRIAFIRDANIATGHALQTLTSNRNRVFHDVRINSGTIDNVLVGLHGIYTINVIARKPGRHNSVRLVGDQLTFASGKHAISVAQAGRKAENLAREVRKLLRHEVRVRPVIAVPGWEIESQKSNDYLVVNERTIAMLRGWKDERDYLMNEDVAAVHKLLTKRCMRYGTK